MGESLFQSLELHEIVSRDFGANVFCDCKLMILQRHQSASGGSGSEPTALDGLSSEEGVATLLGQANEGHREAVPGRMAAKGKSIRNQDSDLNGEDLGESPERASDLVRRPRISSGPMEGTNNKIKTMKRQAYGYRNMGFFELKILSINETRYALVR